MSESKPVTRIIDLKPNLENIHVKGRVLETSPPRVISTRRGARTISNAVLGDGSGRVEVTLWGMKAGSLQAGDAVEVIGAWTTAFRGKVQLNIGKSTVIKKIEDSDIPEVESIPEYMPKAPPNSYRSRSGFRAPRRGRSFRGRR